MPPRLTQSINARRRYVSRIGVSLGASEKCKGGTTETKRHFSSSCEQQPTPAASLHLHRKVASMEFYVRSGEYLRLRAASSATLSVLQASACNYLCAKHPAHGHTLSRLHAVSLMAAGRVLRPQTACHYSPQRYLALQLPCVFVLSSEPCVSSLGGPTAPD